MLTISAAEGTTTPPIRWEGITTPPILSSSPGYGNESMDISPLPHKAPFSLVAKITIESPTPATTPLDEDMMAVCPEPSNTMLEVPKPLNGAEYDLKQQSLTGSLWLTLEQTQEAFIPSTLALSCEGLLY